ncbi:glycerol-3-phosphate dehydrogenase/oxidase [Glaciihabitans sp. dw_435]|uniref:glycerol-3-phosphate dehydrogenase/oxidase n=1 Tax=Glaciihabitans sp. dw_435 TaxID=2720081 RepID=UPI001BD6252E|nr:glycerol-3-phosphate dehydrogenase/oxidase [Glaciihabitans sp. dw_435]
MVTQSKTTGELRDNVAGIVERPSAQVLIIGGGINGLASFRDLTLQGVDVVLVERGDYVSGASSASSHMIHGGIRYLENGEFRLVRESVQERNGLLKTAPHYVKPLKTTIPIFSTVSGILNAPIRLLTHKQRSTKERGAALIKIGLTLYDSFSRDGGTVPRHEFKGRRESLKALPKLNPGIKYTATYYDASMHDPERLALDVLHDGLQTGSKARAANYVEAIALTAEGVLVRDTVSGTEFTIASEVVVNTSGPWTDVTNENLGMPTQYMGGTKGSHIVVENEEMLTELAGRELFFENNDGRIVLIYPLKGKVMIGTTDLEADVREPVVATEDEIDYFFDLVKHVLPTVKLDRSQIVYSFAGIRPLPKHDDETPGFVSRDYRIEKTPITERPGSTLVSLVGGKWTTFRALSEHMSNEVLGLLGLERTVSTVGRAIGGGKGFPLTEAATAKWVAANAGTLPAARVDELLQRYGTRATEFIAFLGENDDEPLASNAHYSRAEIEYLVTHEYVVNMADVLLRRTSLAFTGQLTGDLLEEIASIMTDALGWTAEQRATELADTRAMLKFAHGVTVSEPASVTK